MKFLINSQFYEENAALISVNERGFRFGDGVFETISFCNTAPYLWEYHIQRLQAGLKALRIHYEIDNLLPQAIDLLGENSLENGILRIYISRGIGSQGYLPTGNQPTIVIQVLEKPTPPTQSVDLWLSDYKKNSLQALPVNCKLSQGVNSTLAKMQAVDNNCYDALQLNLENYVSETSSSNIFWLKNGILHTPSLDCDALAGVTRRRIMEISPYKIEQGKYKISDLEKAEAVILTNSAYGIISVRSLFPQGFSWDSEALAKQLINLRNQDISLAIKVAKH